MSSEFIPAYTGPVTRGVKLDTNVQLGRRKRRTKAEIAADNEAHLAQATAANKHSNELSAKVSAVEAGLAATLQSDRAAARGLNKGAMLADKEAPLAEGLVRRAPVSSRLTKQPEEMASMPTPAGEEITRKKLIRRAPAAKAAAAIAAKQCQAKQLVSLPSLQSEFIKDADDHLKSSETARSINAEENDEALEEWDESVVPLFGSEAEEGEDDDCEEESAHIAKKNCLAVSNSGSSVVEIESFKNPQPKVNTSQAPRVPRQPKMATPAVQVITNTGGVVAFTATKVKKPVAFTPNRIKEPFVAVTTTPDPKAIRPIPSSSSSPTTYSNSDIPENLLGTWLDTILPSLLYVLGGLQKISPWHLDPAVFSHVLQTLVNQLAPKANYLVVASQKLCPLFYVACQRKSDWLSRFGYDALNVVSQFLMESFTRDPDRVEHARFLLGTGQLFRFIFEHPGETLQLCIGPFRNRLILKVLAPHLNQVAGVKKVKGLERYYTANGFPYAALALAVTAVRRALTLWAMSAVVVDTINRRHIKIQTDRLTDPTIAQFGSSRWGAATAAAMHTIGRLDNNGWMDVLNTAENFTTSDKFGKQVGAGLVHGLDDPFANFDFAPTNTVS